MATEGCEDHCDAEGDEAEAADAGYDVVAKEAVELGLGGGVVVVEGVLLAGGELEFHFGHCFEVLVDVGERPADVVEDFVEGGAVDAGEDVEPLELEVDVVEDEAGEEAVLGVRDEGADLAGRAGEDGGEARAQEFDEFAVLAAGVGDGLVVEGFAEAVGEVAVVGGEDVGEGIAFGLEHQGIAAVVGEDLIDGGCGAVGRDDEHPQGRLFRRFGGIVFLLVVLVAGFLEAVFVHLGLIGVAELVVDGLDEAAAEGELAFAGRCGCRDKEEEVGIDLTAAVDTEDFGEATGEADDGAEEENVGIFVGVGLADDGFEEVREVAVEFLGEGGHWFRAGRFHQSVVSINSIS